MLKLTMPGPAACTCYVNPRLVTDIMPRWVRSTEPGATSRDSRIEGCRISFGGPADSSSIAVMEPAEVVAEFVADHAGDSYMGVVDVPAEIKKRAAERDEKVARGICPGCSDIHCVDCIPF